MSATKPTPTPFELIAQDGAGHYIAHRDATGTLRLIAHMLERKHSLEEDLANGKFIVLACNNFDALIAALEYYAVTPSSYGQVARAALKDAKGEA